jgi:hypothetical protein
MLAMVSFPCPGSPDLAGVPARTVDSLIHLASVMRQIDYAREGRILGRLGLADIPRERLLEFLYEGDL